MKILLVTFDKEMDKKIRELLKDHQIVTVKNGEEALLLNMDDVDLIIYDALAGGIAEEDINKLYEEGFKDVPYIILMDDLFPIDPKNVKPKNKKVISREVEVERLPEIVEQVVSGKATTPAEEVTAEQPAETAAAEAAPSEESWEAMFGQVVETHKGEKKEEEKPAEVAPQPQPAEEKKEEKPVEEATPAAPAAAEIPTNKQCLLVSFDMPLVDKIQEKIKDLCDLHIARSSKQALQKYKNKDFDIIIFDTISGVFAEKGIRDLYEKGGYKDSLYVVLLDEFMPIDVDKLPVKNLRAIKRESELDLLPEIIENAPHITLEKALQGAAESVEAPAEGAAETAEVETGEALSELEKLLQAEEKKEEKPAETVTPSAAVEEKKPVEEKAAKPAPQPQPRVEKAPVQPPKKPAPAAQPPVQPAPAQPVAVSEELIERIVEQKIAEKVLPLIDELIKNKLSDDYLKTVIREVIEDRLPPGEIREIVQEVAEPIVKEILEQLLA